ncbi:MAG: hypothetical protein K5665_09205 [Saccharofermentans sp.]|nr:hypothetical protein [Saccharofermentans sp.]
MSKSENKGKAPEKNNEITAQEADEKISLDNDASVDEIKETDKDSETDEEVKEAETEYEFKGKVTESSESESEDDLVESSDSEADEKEEPAAEDKEADAEVSEEKAVVSEAELKTKKENEEFRKLPFIEKCKIDPLIPVLILLAFAALIISGIYFVLPEASTKSMGITYEEFKTRFNQSEVMLSLMNSGLDIGLNPVPYVDRSITPSILGDNEEFKVSRSYADYFAGPVRYYPNAGVEGAARRSDGYMAYIRIYVPYDEDVNPVWMYTANTLETLYPDMEHFVAMNIALGMLGDYSGDGKYSVKGNYAIRLIPTKNNDTTYIVIEAVPRTAVKSSQIGTNYDDSDFANLSGTASESVTESITESVTEST